jgi:hypothetical protein
MNNHILFSVRILYLILALITTISQSAACTIFCAKSKNGNVWAGNNEDQLFNFRTCLNIVASTDSTLGYISFTNSNRQSEFIQGGINEAGLFYDGNAVPFTEYKNFDKKKAFPGSERNMIEYILRKCKTVPEVLALFNTYRLPGLETGQMHFADKFGNFGIVVADSMWLTKENYQISTNYNLCHSNKDNMDCWRFPIAESLLKSREINFETFKTICDSTSQKSMAGTVYSNIHNLNTGDVYFFYGMNYKTPYKTTISELLDGGTRSFYLYELFNSFPLVSTYNTYRAAGASMAISKLSLLSPQEKRTILFQLTDDLIICNHDFNAYPFLRELIDLDGDTVDILSAFNAFALFCMDRKTKAKQVLETSLKKFPDNGLFKDLLNQMNGRYNPESNCNFELKGYNTAKFVYVEGLDDPSIEYFLIRNGNKWIGKFLLPPEEYHYYFSVDGKKILDSNNKEQIIVDGEKYNKITIKK